MPLALLRPPGAPPKLVGHRGACDVAPENTLISFQRALDDGADIVEMDVRLTADGHIVVMHDARVDRTTDGFGAVAEMTLAQVRALDAGAWFAPRFAGARVPTLDEVLVWARGRIVVMLELKSPYYGDFDPALAPAVVKRVQAHAMTEQVVFISYQPRSLCQVRELLPEVPVGPLPPRDRLLELVVWLAERWAALKRLSSVRRVLLRPLALTRSHGCNVVGANIAVVTAELVEAAHALGMPLSPGGFAWDYPRHIAMGVDTVSSNDPGAVRRRYLSGVTATPAPDGSA